MRKVPTAQEEEGKLVGCGGETEGTRALALPHTGTLGRDLAHAKAEATSSVDSGVQHGLWERAFPSHPGVHVAWLRPGVPLCPWGQTQMVAAETYPGGPRGQNTKQKDWLPGQSQQAAQIRGACSTCSPGEGLQVPVETSSLTHADQRLIQPCVSTSATCQHSLWAGPTQVAAFTGSQPTILQQGQIRIPRESLQDFRTPISFYLQSYAQIPLKEGGLGQAWAEPVLSKASEHPKRLFKWLHQTKFIS